MSLIAASALRRCAPLLAAAGLVAACSTTPNRAPVEERSPTPRATVAAASPAASAASSADTSPAPAPDSNSGKPGFYTVKAGDTLSSIAAAQGVDWHTLYSNNAQVIGGNANLIYPGQTITV